MSDYINDGYIQLAAAIVNSVADDYVKKALSLDEMAQKNARQLEKWFYSGYADTLTMGHGDVAAAQAKEKAIDKAIKKYSVAALGAYVAAHKLLSAKSERTTERLKSTIARNKGTVEYISKWFKSPWADSICGGKAGEYLKQARKTARQLISEYKAENNLV